MLRDLERRAPSGTAESWDNVGLLLGGERRSAPLRGAVVSIDLTDRAIALAAKKGYRLIVTHHPAIFPKGRGPSSVIAPDRVHQAIRSGISVVSTHTNFDRSALEVSQAVARGLGIAPMGRFYDRPKESLTKLVVFVPESHVERVRLAVCAAGAGQIGQYDQCTFTAEGTGTFRGGLDTQPFVGRRGALERIPEVRLETILPRGLEKLVLKALKAAHPYEEVAYDFIPASQDPGGLGLVSGLGYGVWGDVSGNSSGDSRGRRAKTFPEVIQSVKSLFKLDGLVLTEAKGAPRAIRRIGFVAGKGSSFLSAAAKVGCDLFITGEVGYHDACSSARDGLSVMEIGHRESEIFFPRTVAAWLKELGLAVAIEDTPTQHFVS